jgi:F420-dependent methylenetetrahydromethanopterin dehydrogenase
MKMVDGFPRRGRVEFLEPAEAAIYDAMSAVEATGAHPLLTDAVTLLRDALNKVSDFVDMQPPNYNSTP